MSGVMFLETERGTGAVGTVFQEPQPEPSLSVKPLSEASGSGIGPVGAHVL